MLGSCLILATLVAAQAPPEIDPLIVVRANILNFSDVQFEFEGQVRIFRNGGEVSAEQATRGEDYRGSYSYRTGDGATTLDLYRRPIAAGMPWQHSSRALIGGSLARIEHLAVEQQAIQPTTKGNGGPGSLLTSNSPELFVAFATLRDRLLDPKGYHFKDLGWNDVGGVRCRRVQFDEFWDFPDANPPIVHYWLDLDRGGTPLKMEYIRRNNVWMRVHAIRPIRARTPGGVDVWVPIEGTTDMNGLKLMRDH